MPNLRRRVTQLLNLAAASLPDKIPPESPLFRLYTSQGLIGCQFQLFDLALLKVPDLCLQCRLGNGSHLERQRNRVLGWPAGSLSESERFQPGLPGQGWW